jgi:hypothetical protein
MVSQNNINISKEAIINYCKQHNIIEFALFGSVLTNQFHSNSDIDVLVTFQPDCHYSFYDIVAIQEDLENMFARPVDLVEKQSLKNPFRKHEILKNMEVIYVA